jgi:hypothetical protein
MDMRLYTPGDSHGSKGTPQLPLLHLTNVLSFLLHPPRRQSSHGLILQLPRRGTGSVNPQRLAPERAFTSAKGPQSKHPIRLPRHHVISTLLALRLSLEPQGLEVVARQRRKRESPRHPMRGHLIATGQTGGRRRRIWVPGASHRWRITRLVLQPVYPSPRPPFMASAGEE